MMIFREKVLSSLKLQNTEINLRPMGLKDYYTIFEWNQLPEIRRYYRNTNPPTKEEHQCWFNSKITAIDSVVLMIIKNDKTIGTIRLDKNENVEISIMVDPKMQCHGVAKKTLNLITDLIQNEKFTAEIYPDNIASITAFSNAGFKHAGNNWYHFT